MNDNAGCGPAVEYTKVCLVFGGISESWLVIYYTNHLCSLTLVITFLSINDGNNMFGNETFLCKSSFYL